MPELHERGVVAKRHKNSRKPREKPNGERETGNRRAGAAQRVRVLWNSSNRNSCTHGFDFDFDFRGRGEGGFSLTF